MQVESRIASGNLFSYAFCAPENAERCLSGLREELDRLVDEGITADELADARMTWRREFEMNLGDDADFAATLLSLQENGRCLGYYVELQKRMESLSAADVNRVLHDQLARCEFLSVQAGDF